jgi:hypothetical protein
MYKKILFNKEKIKIKKECTTASTPRGKRGPRSDQALRARVCQIGFAMYGSKAQKILSSVRTVLVIDIKSVPPIYAYLYYWFVVNEKILGQEEKH